MRVECGWREYVCAETPELAVTRGIIVVEATRQWREMAPKRRPHLQETIRAVARFRGVSGA